jgi:hypothetical protein
MCQNFSAMCTMLLAMKTPTAESKMGNQRWTSETMGTSSSK